MAATFAPDTGLKCVVAPGLGYKRGKLQKYQRRGYSAIIIHTTGRGVHRKAERWGVDPFDATLRIFATQVDASGTYVVGQKEGQLAQVVPEDIAAWNVGGKNFWKYNRADWWRKKQVAWWRDRWPQFISPRQFASGALWLPSPTTGKPSCNANVLSLEVVPPPGNGEWSAECWKTIAELCWDISRRRDIPLSLETVLSHSDAHPFARSAKGRPWDPSPTQWSYEKFAKHTGLPLISGVGTVSQRPLQR